MFEDETLAWADLEPGSSFELKNLGLWVEVNSDGTPILTSEILHHALLRENFFPRLNGRKYEIPPCFTSNGFTPEVADRLPKWKELPKERHNIGFELMPFKQTRPDGFLRRSAIPHPWPHAQIAKLFASNWHISERLHQNELSAIRPMVYSDGRVFSSTNYDEPEHVFERWWEEARFGSNFVLQLDIKSFFPSVYTHSLCWSTHSKKLSKLLARGKGPPTGAAGFQQNEFCNQLDTFLKNQNQNQTLGIPIGPGTSNLVGEFLLLDVDEKLEESFGPRFLRFVDDYYFAAKSEEEADRFTRALEDELNKVELSLNPLKTSLTPVSREIRASWLNDLRLLLATPLRSKLQVVSYWDKVLRIAGESGNGAALRYGMRGLLDQSQESGLLRDAVGILIHQIATLPFLSPLLGRAIELGYSFSLDEASQLLEVVVKRGNRLYSDSLNWIVFVVIRAGLRPEGLAKQVVDIGDPLALTLAYEYLPDPEGLIKGRVRNSLQEDGLSTDSWLLAYQISRRESGLDDADGVFSILRENGVDFLDRDKLAPF